MEKEADIQRTIIEYLKYKRLFWWRNNSGALKTEHGGFIRFGATGSPDIFIVKDGKIYGLEVKAEKGKQSDNQLLFQQGFEKAGGLYFVVRSLKDVADIGI